MLAFLITLFYTYRLCFDTSSILRFFRKDKAQLSGTLSLSNVCQFIVLGVKELLLYFLSRFKAIVNSIKTITSRRQLPIVFHAMSSQLISFLMQCHHQHHTLTSRPNSSTNSLYLTLLLLLSPSSSPQSSSPSSQTLTHPFNPPPTHRIRLAHLHPNSLTTTTSVIITTQNPANT